MVNVTKLRGPHGRSKKNHTNSSTIINTKNPMTYGSILDINVPKPAFLSYFFANAKSIPKYANVGQIGFVIASPIRYAICTNAGEYPISMNIGTNILLSNDHFVDAEPIRRFKKLHIMTNKMMIAHTGKPDFSRAVAPWIAMISPRFDQSKYFKNCAIK